MSTVEGRHVMLKDWVSRTLRKQPSQGSPPAAGTPGEALGAHLLRDGELLAEWYVRLRLAEELERARRYHRPQSVLFAVPQLEPNESLSFAAKHAVASAAQLGCRSVDLVGWLGSENILLILPETTDEEAEAAVSRLEDEFWKRSQHVGGQRWKLMRMESIFTARTADELLLGTVRSHIVRRTQESRSEVA